MDLFFYIEKRVLEQQYPIGAALNLTENAAVWFRFQYTYLNTLTWSVCKTYFEHAFRPLDYF